jgi:TolB-like protein/Flp pilus assembly protein TadD
MRFRFGNFEADEEKFLVTREGTPVPMQPKPLSLLLYLLRLHPTVATKDQLFEQLWNDTAVTEYSLTRAVRAARRSLGEGADDTSIIRTVRGRGYAIGVPVKILKSAATNKSKTPSGRPAIAAIPGFFGRPAIAVLPFDNESGESSQDYFAEGLAEDLIVRLARRRRYPIISRNSSFRYKGRAADARQVGAQLGAAYIIEGSVRRAGRRVRITAMLVDGTSGQQLWSGQFDREIDDLFAVQNEVAYAVLGAIDPTIDRIEVLRSSGRDAADFTAWDHFARGASHLFDSETTDLESAKRHFIRAAAIDPQFARAHSFLAVCYAQEINSVPREARDALLDKIRRTARRAVELDQQDPSAHQVLAMSHILSGELDRAIDENIRALELDPSLAIAYASLGNALVLSDRPEEALELIAEALRLSPQDPFRFYFLSMLALAQFAAGRCEEAVTSARASIEARAAGNIASLTLAASYAKLGRLIEASATIDRVLQFQPNLSLATARSYMEALHATSTLIDRVIDSLRAAGLPEPSPTPEK